MKDRIIQFIEKEGLTPAEFADGIGIQRSSLSHVLNGRNNPGFSFIQKILSTYPQIDSRWLITGEGSMTTNAPIEIIKQKSTPDLFSEPQKSTPQAKVKEIELPQEEVKPIALSDLNPPVVDKPLETIKQIVQEVNVKQIKRVLIFYEDHTFDDYRPSE